MNQDPNDFQKTVRGHIVVALSVLLLAGLTVTVHFLELDPRPAAIIVLSLAAIQVFLVVQFLMHLVEEKSPVIAIVAFTTFFVAALLALSVTTYHDLYDGAYHSGAPVVDASGEESH